MAISLFLMGVRDGAPFPRRAVIYIGIRAESGKKKKVFVVSATKVCSNCCCSHTNVLKGVDFDPSRAGKTVEERGWRKLMKEPRRKKEKKIWLWNYGRGVDAV